MSAGGFAPLRAGCPPLLAGSLWKIRRVSRFQAPTGDNKRHAGRLVLPAGGRTCLSCAAALCLLPIVSEQATEAGPRARESLHHWSTQNHAMLLCMASQYCCVRPPEPLKGNAVGVPAEESCTPNRDAVFLDVLAQILSSPETLARDA